MLSIRERRGVLHGLKTSVSVNGRLWNEQSLQSLAAGDQIKMGPLGLERHPKYINRVGFIVGRASRNSWRVKFDGSKSIQSIHRTYLEKV